MAISEFNAALNQVAAERGITVDSVIESVKTALATAYKKDRKEAGEEVELEEIEVDLNTDTGEVKIIKDKKDVTPSGFGRIAAQTAKQVILQKIRETEKEVVTSEFRAKIGQIMLGTVFRIDNGLVTLDLGKTRAQGVMPSGEQVPFENYRINQRLKVLVKDIKESPRGTEVVVSRSDPQFVVKLFEQEVPEIASGVVVVEAVAREAGSRTKMAVSSKDEKVDPVGSCVGQKGVRVQAIIAELFGEKIDIIPFYNITEKFIAASLSPAKVAEVVLDKENKRAVVTVPEEQQSLAIGKEGQNARLANKLTKWKIDIKGAAGIFSADSGEAIKIGAKEDKKVVGVWDEAIKKTEDEKIEKDRVRKEEEAAAEVEKAPEESVESGTEETQDVQSEENTPAE
ncbi:transcription termination factor NusA [candidate division WWE3 bacterium RIFOXYA12_FULL_43_11]|uniref:Transcription termination/antitermination protein NusA n=1 Tax=candidate division WWE3 bacterium TaxID=2053526 RepID=A0A3D0ZR27_UNCKA|nr:MAG: transcription termination factor NusA [candidate division WWE3 bacterium RIFOXYA2_FULL_43_12]OGC64675.1 MAG: transcription termination factor NusA [candidate division WWE3 bacterium RIFOXYA12_FULL_43_11]OGC72012.1 MAG: transcription termination factor NusA [candidate division WWE3 bacterium RIFOXYB2_FULL_43_9]OGC75696.1 MAG: transcription termination factor NusA [candidate division WWE3 bacterium RIFOXYD2_FULL_43_10]HBY09821.1 transcription termination factor NusA [candidate division WW